MTRLEDVDLERAWATTALGAVVAILGGIVLFPRAVWDRFLWKYLWGPVYADATNAPCATIVDGVARPVHSANQCGLLELRGATVAEPGYTLVSEAVYASVLLFALVGVYLLLRRLDLGTDRAFLYALLPFVVFGGALRVIEDALDAAGSGGVPIDYPANALLISPIIYGTVFAVTLLALLGSLWLARRNRIESYAVGLAASGSVVLLLTLGYLGYLAATTAYVGFYPQILVAVLGGAGLLTGLIWVGIERFEPAINAGTGRLGLVVLFAHSVDGVANVVGIDWGAELGLPYGDLAPKHPVNDAMIGLGAWLSEVVAGVTGGAFVLADLVGTAWPFLLLKLTVAVAVIWLFDDAVFEESPRYAILLLIAIVAVGLGPGTRDMLRATFGV